MLNKFEAKIAACGAIADLFGVDYFRKHIEEACESYPTDDYNDVDYEYFLGFERNGDTNLWKIL